MQKVHLFRTKSVLTAFFALLVMFQSCKKSDLQEVTAAQNDNIAVLQQAVAGSVGTTLDKVVYLKNEERFVVDGDSYVTLQDARLRFSSSERPSVANGTSQMVGYYTITSSKVNAIKIFSDTTVPYVWNVALDSAIANWNATGSQVKMQRVSNSGEATTLVNSNYSVSSIIATAAYPNFYGNPGSKITINSYHNGLAALKKIFAITHELGHTLGFSHTDQTYGTLISGTPISDPSSVMNSVCLYWAGFTNYDKVAVNTVYPFQPATTTTDTAPATKGSTGNGKKTR